MRFLHYDRTKVGVCARLLWAALPTSLAVVAWSRA